MVITYLSKLEHQLPHRAIGEFELLGNIFLRSSVNKDGPQGFIPSVIGLAWLGEELLISRIIHELASVKMLVVIPDTGERILPAGASTRGVEPG